MSDSGSILQLQPKITALNRVNLLIITSKATDLKAIASPLHQSEIEFTYDTVARQQHEEQTFCGQYSAVLYDYQEDDLDCDADNSIKQLEWWLHLCADLPLVLLTNSLGEENAVELIQLGVKGYVLKNNIQRLPKILKRAIYGVASQKAIAQQQQNTIDERKARIHHLETQQKTWDEQTKVKQERILHLVHQLAQQQEEIDEQQTKICHLKAEIQKSAAEKKAEQEQISYLVHELRNPVAAIIGFSGSLKEQYFGKLNPKQMQYACALYDSGKYLSCLVDNYLGIAKMDANKQKLDLQPIAVEEFCQACMMIVNDKAEAKGLSLTYDIGSGVDVCTADLTRLKEVLINLLSNAIKFTDRGGVTLDVSRQEDVLHFAVSDTGTGISKENISKLFEPFPQISNRYDSTGLGLTLSRKIALLHGGEIKVRSELDKGSCFTLILPIESSISEEKDN